MSNPLNPGLYRRLQLNFHRVKFADEGTAMQAQGVLDAAGDKQLIFTQSGEYYRICCPYCNDTRFRLYVSYMFGKRDTF